MLTLKTITSQVQVEDWFVTVDLEMPIFPFKSSSGTGNSFSLPLEESLTSTKFFPLAWPGLRPEEVHKVHGCCSAPFDAPGHLCTQLPVRLAHTGPIQGDSELSQRYRPPPHSGSWPQNKHQKECSHHFSTNFIFGGSLGFCSNAGPSGSCPDLHFQRMFGPLKARPQSFCEHLSQTPRSYGRSFPYATSRIAPHETIPLVDESVEDPLQRTSHLPNQGVAQLLSYLLNMEFLSWHINCLELRAVFLVLINFSPFSEGVM